MNSIKLPNGEMEYRVYNSREAALLEANDLLHSGRAQSVKTQPIFSKYQPCPCGSGKKFKWCHGAAARKSPPAQEEGGK